MFNFICSNPRKEWTDLITGNYYNYAGLNRDLDNPWVVRKPTDAYVSIYSFNFGSYVNIDCKGSRANIIEQIEVMGHPTPSCSKYGYMEYASAKMINSADPYEGIIVTYGMGDSCYNIAQNKLAERQTNFFLLCKEEQSANVYYILLSLVLKTILMTIAHLTYR
jgi:hypothetical protein